MLAPEALRYSPLKKKLASFLYHSCVLAGTACLHATSEQEFLDIRAYGLKQPVAILPHGIDIPVYNDVKTKAPVVLSLGRIHPIKGIDRLILAWSSVHAEFPNWRLKIIGPSDSDGYGQKLMRLVCELGLPTVEFGGPVYGLEKQRLLAEAGLFVLPSLNENFAMTVAENLAGGTPVISTKGAPWAGLAENRCGWWVDHGPEAMAAALRKAMSLSDEERRAMGARGRAWMHRDYGWDGIAKQMIEVYRWLLDGGELPVCIRI